MRIALVGAELEENLALRYLEGALRAEGHEVLIVPFDWPRDVERAAQAIVRSGAAMAGFSMVFTRRGKEFARLITRTRELGFEGLIVAGGSFAAFHAELLLRDVPALDAIGIGEGEGIMCELARDGAKLAEIDGLVWREPAGTVRRNPPAVPVDDLDTLPWPTHRRPYDSYFGMPIVNMLSSRGCSYGCGFCSIAAWHRMTGGARYRRRQPDAIAAEMACLWRDGVRLFNFHDDNFLGPDRDDNLRRARAFAEALARQQIGPVGFQIKARPDAVDREVFATLRQAGLFRVFLGIEAGTPTSLKALGRGQRLEHNVAALDILEDLGVHLAFNLLMLNPDSTLEDFEGNVAFLRAHARTPLNFCRTEIYAETPLERRLRTQDRLIGDYWGLDYVIADPRAQRVFEVYTEAFYERCFGAHPLHYLSGQVDYEHQLRADFFGTTAALRAAAKGFVRRVNENTATHLEHIVAAVREDRATQDFAAELAARVAADDLRLHGEGRAIIDRLHDSKTPEARRAPGLLSAAAALALAACSGPGHQTQPMEAAPPPPGNLRPIDAAVPEAGPADAGAAVAAPPDAGVPDAGAPDAATTARPVDAGPRRQERWQQAEAAPPPPYRKN